MVSQKCINLSDIRRLSWTKYRICRSSKLINLKLRPIVGGPICPTQTVSDLSGKIKPLFLPDKNYTMDNKDFLERFRKISFENRILVTFDIVSLSKNIHNVCGLEAPFNEIDKHLDKEFF